MKDPQTCPICGGHMECIHQSTDTWECDTCDYIVGEYKYITNGDN